MSTAAAIDPEVVLRLEALSVDYVTESGPAPAVRDVDLSVRRGEIVGLVGESGCGKSTLGQSILRILRPPGVITGGRILLEGEDVLTMSPVRLRQFRWSKASIVMQNSLTALNPVQRIDRQIVEAQHSQRHRAGLRTVSELLTMVGIDPRRAHSYPHEFSGGMRQRVAIAMALALSPSLVIMDEPTTALDVVVQREIVESILRLRDAEGFGVLFITHDLPLLLEYADRIVVMRDGAICEEASAADLLEHGGTDSYTNDLLGSLPQPDLRPAADVAKPEIAPDTEIGPGTEIGPDTENVEEQR